MASNSRQQRFQHNSSIFPTLAIPKLQLANLPKSILGPQTESHALESQTERSGLLNPILPNTVPSHHSAVTSRPSVNVMQNIVCFSSFDPFKSKSLPQDLVQYLDLLENKIAGLAYSMAAAFRQIDVNKDGLIEKAELKGLLGRFNLTIPEEVFTRIWDLFLDPGGHGKISLAEFLDKFKADEGWHPSAIPSGASLALRGPFRDQVQGQFGPSGAAGEVRAAGGMYQASTDYGVFATHGKGTVPLARKHLGEAHHSEGYQRNLRYCNMFPFHSQRTVGELPGVQSYDVFREERRRPVDAVGSGFSAAAASSFWSAAQERSAMVRRKMEPSCPFGIDPTPGTIAHLPPLHESTRTVPRAIASGAGGDHRWMNGAFRTRQP